MTDVDEESHWAKLVRWFGDEFGAEQDAESADQLVIVFEGSPGECQVAALRLKAAGIFVLPDPTTSTPGRFPTDPYRAAYTPGGFSPQIVGIAVRRDDVDRAHAVIADVEPI